MAVHSVVCFVAIVAFACASSNIIRIGGLYDPQNKEQELAFKYAVNLMNEVRILNDSIIRPRIYHVMPNNDFQVHQKVCSLFSNGVYAIFGPSSSTSSKYVQSMCDTKEIPHIDFTWNMNQQRHSCQINLYPYSPVLATVYADLVTKLEWKSFTILYEDNLSLSRISSLLKLNGLMNKITLKQLDQFHTRNYRPVLSEIKGSGERNIVLDCSIDILEDVLKHALQVGLMADHYNYIITNLDLHTIDLYPYQHGGANITGVQMVDPEDPTVSLIANELQNIQMNSSIDFTVERNPEWKLRIGTALLYDAVHLFTEALKQLHFTRYVKAKRLYCNMTDNWERGYTLINYMKMSTTKGLTGLVKFDHQGFRSNFHLNIIELTNKGVKNVGKWNSSGLNFSRGHLYDRLENEMSLQNISFTVLIALSDPYGMLKEASQTLSGNDRFEGFGIDLIHMLSEMLGFNYTFKLQEDGQYGTKNRITGHWDGMIKELLKYRADLAITDLTITSERESAVDFTMPFMNLGISILYKKPMKLPPSLFSFMSPFSQKVWFYLGGTYVAVSLILYLIARISPAEWTNRLPCVDEPEYLENQFSLKNTFWFTIGSLMQEGTDLAPIAISTRLVAGTWWFFTLILVSSYTANLAAFLTIESLSPPFKNVEELVSKGNIKFGAKRGGSTANFFRDSKYSTYNKIWEYMEAHPHAMTFSNPDGVKRAENENYAFFMESTTIEYTTQRHCNLTQIGGLLDDKGYGIAMRKNSLYRNDLSAAVVKLQENGKLASLKDKWWKEKRGGGGCQKDETAGEGGELGLPNLGGVFLVFVVGSIGGVVLGIIEMLLNVAKHSRREKITYMHALSEEISFILKFKQRVKPVKRRRSSRQSSGQSSSEFSTSRYGYVPDLTKESIQ